MLTLHTLFSAKSLLNTLKLKSLPAAQNERTLGLTLNNVSGDIDRDVHLEG